MLIPRAFADEPLGKAVFSFCFGSMCRQAGETENLPATLAIPAKFLTSDMDNAANRTLKD